MVDRIWLVCLLLAACGAQAQEPQGGLPNVVLILADDFGWGDARCYNPDSKIPTPHLDRLAREGMRFTDAHSPSAVCSPTRYGLLTGRYSWRSRLESGVLWGWSQLLIEPGRETIATLLRRAGYRTGCVGKWHLGLGAFDPTDPDKSTDFDAELDAGPHTVGFDDSFIFPGSLDMEPYLYVRDGEVVEPATEETRSGRRRWSGGEGYWRSGPIAPGFAHEDVLPRMTEEAVALIKSYAEAPDEPFFLYFPLTAPHTPWVPTEEFQGSSEAGWYGDFAAQCDASVGRVLAALDDAELTEETLVVFSSDNGAHWRTMDIESYAHAANGPWRGMKADIYEAGHRVPMIVRWPARVKAGSTCDALVGLLDWYATLAEVVGRERSADEAPDSVSFLAALDGRTSGLRTELVHHSFDGMFALRSGPWKLVEGRGSGGFTDPPYYLPLPGEPLGQLYDLSADPAETNNLFARKPERVIKLLKRLDSIRL